MTSFSGPEILGPHNDVRKIHIFMSVNMFILPEDRSFSVTHVLTKGLIFVGVYFCVLSEGCAHPCVKAAPAMAPALCTAK